jgi:hypothetical protein
VLFTDDKFGDAFRSSFDGGGGVGHYDLSLLVIAWLDPAIHDEVLHIPWDRMDYRISHWQAMLRMGQCGPVMTRSDAGTRLSFDWQLQ